MAVIINHDHLYSMIFTKVLTTLRLDHNIWICNMIHRHNIISNSSISMLCCYKNICITRRMSPLSVSFFLIVMHQSVKLIGAI